jgi:hypothetical protein
VENNKAVYGNSIPWKVWEIDFEVNELSFLEDFQGVHCEKKEKRRGGYQFWVSDTVEEGIYITEDLAENLDILLIYSSE